MEEFLVKWVILKELEIIYTKIYQETLGKINASIQNSLTSCRKKIDANQGMDVTLIKQLVNQILGLEEIGSRFKPMLENLTQQDRNQYFQWMKESQFLESSFSNLNEIRIYLNFFRIFY